MPSRKVRAEWGPMALKGPFQQCSGGRQAGHSWAASKEQGRWAGVGVATEAG